jgi:hypothetical protein
LFVPNRTDMTLVKLVPLTVTVAPPAVRPVSPSDVFTAVTAGRLAADADAVAPVDDTSVPATSIAATKGTVRFEAAFRYLTATLPLPRTGLCARRQ